LGIEAENKALALNPDYYEALIFKNILLRQQALFETSPAVQKQLISEADVLMAKAEELKKKQAAAPPPATEKPGGSGR
jgi:hypothetical protein